ncbi:MAG: methyltransferase domain-containing protein [Candidatus Omnitrophota bacterium]|nr:methyltransferase domain-containing protein [Candidatus Omnitrophota bacterium]
MFDLNSNEIKKLVKGKYSKVARDPYAVYNFPVGKTFALKVGYPKEVLDTLPISLTESFTGANNPQPFVELKQDEIVLDLGCGGGLDLYFYSQAVGPEGKVYAVDISEDMVNRAKDNMRKTGRGNVEIRIGESDRIPFGDNFFNVVASNGIYNLSPDKEAAMKDVYRVLKSGGRTVFCEIVLKEALSEGERKNHSDWFRCIGGALVEKDFTVLMKKVGFKNIEVISKCRNARTGHPYAICANIRAYK